MRFNGPVSFCGPVSEVVRGGKRTKQPPVLANPDPLQPWGLSQGSSTGTVPAPYLLDFTEGFCGLPYLFQSSSWKVCIQTAFAEVGCTGKVACGIASHGLSNSQKGLEGGGLSVLQGRRAGLACPGITWFHHCTAAQPGTNGLELKGFQGKGVLTRTF